MSKGGFNRTGWCRGKKTLDAEIRSVVLSRLSPASSMPQFPSVENECREFSGSEACVCGSKRPESLWGWRSVGSEAPGAIQSPCPVRTLACSVGSCCLQLTLGTFCSISYERPYCVLRPQQRGWGHLPMLTLTGQERFCLEFGGPGIKL